MLQTSCAALAVRPTTNELERSVLQIHTQLLRIVTTSLSRCCGAGSELFTERHQQPIDANEEVLAFLEVQAKAQVRLLEAELTAGKELLRLHKSQHEKERSEVDGVDLLQPDSDAECMSHDSIHANVAGATSHGNAIAMHGDREAVR